MRPLSVITSSFIRTPFGELTVYQLASVVAGTDKSFGAIGKSRAENALRSHGINVDPKRGIIAFAPNDPNLQKLAQKQSFAHGLRGQLKRLSVVTTNDNKPMRFDSGSHKVLVLPLGTIGLKVAPEYVS